MHSACSSMTSALDHQQGPGDIFYLFFIMLWALQSNELKNQKKCKHRLGERSQVQAEKDQKTPKG